MEQRRARLSDVLSSAGVEVQRTPDNVLLLRWPADRAFAGNTTQPNPAPPPMPFETVWPQPCRTVRSGAARAPLVANDSPEGRARNRRVELWLTD